MFSPPWRQHASLVRLGHLRQLKKGTMYLANILDAPVENTRARIIDGIDAK